MEGEKRKEPAYMSRGKSAKAEKRTFWESVSRALGFSPDLLFGGMTVTVYGGKQAVIEGMKRIEEYDESIFRARGGKQELRVLGSGLSLSNMTEESVVVEGSIQSVEYLSLSEGR